MVNLIIENPCPASHIYWQNDSLFILTAGRVCATQQQSADYLYATAYLFEAKPLPLSLSLSLSTCQNQMQMNPVSGSLHLTN